MSKCWVNSLGCWAQGRGRFGEVTACHCTEQNTLRSYSDFKNRKQGANGLAGRGSTRRDGTGPNGLRLCWGWRAASCRWEHRDCSLLAPLAKLFLSLIWTENVSRLVWVPRGAAGAWPAAASPGGYWGTNCKPRAALGPALYCKILYPRKSVRPGLDNP